MGQYCKLEHEIGKLTLHERQDTRLLIVTANTSVRVTNIAEGLAKMGYAVTLVNCHRSIIPRDAIMQHGVRRITSLADIREVRVGGQGKLFGHLPILLRFFLTWPLTMLHVMREARKASIVIGVTPHLASGLPAMLSSRIFGKPFLLDYPDLVYFGDRVFPINLLAGIERLIVRSADALSVLTELWADFLRTEWGVKTDKIRIVPNAAASPNLGGEVRETHRKMLRTRLHLDESDFLVGYAGSQWYRRLPKRGRVDIQGVDNMIESLQALLETCSNLHLVLAGGVSFPDLPVASIHHLGSFQTGDSTHLQVLLGTDVLILPAEPCVTYQFFDRFKGFEYLASGTPVLAADMPPIRETLGDRVHYYACQDPDSLRKGLLGMMNLFSEERKSSLTEDDTWTARIRVFAELTDQLVQEDRGY